MIVSDENTSWPDLNMDVKLIGLDVKGNKDKIMNLYQFQFELSVSKTDNTRVMFVLQ